MKQKMYLIDLDGTLLDNTLEKIFQHYYTESNDLKLAVNKFNDYYKTDFLYVNKELVKELIRIKAINKNVAICICTNRNEKFKDATIKNLKNVDIEFDDMFFCDGKKADKIKELKKTFDIVVYDDKEEYVKLGGHGSKLFNFTSDEQ